MRMQHGMLLVLSVLLNAFAFTHLVRAANSYNYPIQTPIDVDFSVFQGCTSILVTPQASIEGGMTTHTNDCKQCDSRLSKVPARDWPQGAQKPIFSWRAHFPRHVGSDRGDTYTIENTFAHTVTRDSDISDDNNDNTQNFGNWTENTPIGYIPQVAHTYAYIDGLYGIMNEHQVGIGESTCAARIVSAPVFSSVNGSSGVRGSALLDISALSRLGLERGRTAREVVTIMGELAEKYGFYGAEWVGFLAEGEAGEVLMITDPHESFTFHILGDSTGKSAIWAAQKIPPGHIAVCANAFFIKEINFDDPVNFLFSKNIKSEAQKLNYWQPEFGPFHFTKVYGLLTTFEAYSSRRAWRILSLAAPSLKLSGLSTIDELPFSVEVERKLNHTDIMWMQRDHYEGTEFDLTKGLQAGPYGNPNRYDPSGYLNVTYGVLLQGRFERAISLYRTIYSFVTVSRPTVPNQLALMWFGSGIPHGTYYQPLYIRSLSLPSSLTHGSLHEYDPSSAFWIATAVSGWMEKMYYYTQQDVGAAQIRLESSLTSRVSKFESSLLGSDNNNGNDNAFKSALSSSSSSETEDSDELRAALTQFTIAQGREAHSTWTNLFAAIVTKYHDGFRVDNTRVADLTPISIFYPLWWLQAVGYFSGPPANGHPDLSRTSWQFVVHPPSLPPVHSQSQSLSRSDSQSRSFIDTSGTGAVVSLGWSNGFVFALVTASVIVTAFISHKLSLKAARAQYAPIQSEIDQF